jgi:hypothetical protein
METFRAFPADVGLIKRFFFFVNDDVAIMSYDREHYLKGKAQYS